MCEVLYNQQKFSVSIIIDDLMNLLVKEIGFGYLTHWRPIMFWTKILPILVVYLVAFLYVARQENLYEQSGIVGVDFIF